MAPASGLSREKSADSIERPPWITRAATGTWAKSCTVPCSPSAIPGVAATKASRPGSPAWTTPTRQAIPGSSRWAWSTTSLTTSSKEEWRQIASVVSTRAWRRSRVASSSAYA